MKVLCLLPLFFFPPSDAHAHPFQSPYASQLRKPCAKASCHSQNGELRQVGIKNGDRLLRRDSSLPCPSRPLHSPSPPVVPSRDFGTQYRRSMAVVCQSVPAEAPSVGEVEPSSSQSNNRRNPLISATNVKQAWPWALMAAVAAATLAVPVPAGVDPKGWHLLAIFLSVVVGTMVAPLPVGALCFIAVALATSTGTMQITSALKDISSPNMWLVVMAFFIARAIIKSELGTRIALHFVKRFGQRSLGLAYCMTAAEFCLGPAIPSVTARSGGVVYPLIRSLAQTFNSTAESEESARRLGSYLTLTAFQSSAITCAVFATAMASNPTIIQFANGFLGSNAGGGGPLFTPAVWLTGSIVPGLVNLALIPLFVYVLHKPSITTTPEAKTMAEDGLTSLGPMKKDEKIVAATVLSMLAAWIADGKIPGFHLHPTSTAFAGVSFLLLSKVLSWNDVLAEKGAWDTMVWLSILASLADGPTFNTTNAFSLLRICLRAKALAFFSGKIAAFFAASGLPTGVAFAALSALYVYTHYAFASIGAHTSAMYVSFLTVAAAIGVKPLGAAMMLAYLSSVMGGLTHFATGAAPVMFGSGYVSLKEWWRVGFLSSILNLSIWLILGGGWLKLLGFL